MDDKHNAMCPVYASQRVLTFVHVLLSQAVFMAVRIQHTHTLAHTQTTINGTVRKLLFVSEINHWFNLKINIHIMHFEFLLLLTPRVQLPVQVPVVKVLYGLCENGHISQGGPALSHRMPYFREFFLIHTYSLKHPSI